jgi:N-acetylglucosamine-6-sulfatase
MKYLRFIVFLSVILILGCSSAEPTQATTAPSSQQLARPPNIVFILTDDLDLGVFSHGSRLSALLADEGTTFAQHFVSLSLCCPSRVATLRGQYAHNSGIFSNGGANGGFAKVYADGLENATIATWLQAAGYRTALIGKYLNGYPNGAPSKTYIPPGWTRWFSPNGGNPYSEYNYDLNENGQTVSYGNAPADYLVDVISQKAATFIENTTANFPNKPFFLYIAPYVPHGPATPPPRYANEFPGIHAPRTPSFNEADVSDKPAWVRNKAPLNATQIQKLDDLYRKRRQTLLAVEDLVQNVITALTDAGHLGDTYLFFSSDNGFHQGQHRLNSGKNTAYDEDLRVPLVVRGPGVSAGRTVSSITANVDYAPTWAAIAGIAIPSSVDGRNLVPFLGGATPATWRTALLLEHAGPSITLESADGLLEPQDDFDVQAQASGGAPVFVGIRTAVRTYVEYDTGERELYNLGGDPNQLANAYANADPALVARLSAWTSSLKNAAGATLRAGEEQSP